MTTRKIFLLFILSTAFMSCNMGVETDAVKRLEETIKDKELYNQEFIENADILRNQLRLCIDDNKRWEIASLLYTVKTVFALYLDVGSALIHGIIKLVFGNVLYNRA